ncbi:DUF4249 domain-containing protein [Cesiribacter sp. SM1]|uniref:DUF4249 domain-containing protein n=1 Tax=Cesiribacter sp. SM1 TaxID=2861196 RepID=UPI001CD20DE6|nr:DUF4249 domain-containing protein [Cesiribacter sp. SM1]
MLTTCIEPYTFVIENNEPGLVVEGYISNVSFSESKEYPSDGRYFTVVLHYTSDVADHLNDQAVANASVKLVDDAGAEWLYTETSTPGTYVLKADDFQASPEHAYKLQIALTDGEAYESEWERIAQVAPEMGNIGFEETEKQIYVVEANEQVVRTIKGINVFIYVPPNPSGEPLYYRWNFDSHWIYTAPLARSSNPNFKCWVNNAKYLPGYTLQQDNAGGYRKDLFFIETIRNERIFERFTVLISQQSLTESSFSFWNEMQEQVEKNAFFDTPLYNLQTNIKAVSGDKRAFGYFSVVDEQAKRWYFDIRDLSYYVQNTLKPDCEVSYGPGPPAPPCLDCMEYSKGFTTLEKPSWWEVE